MEIKAKDWIQAVHHEIELRRWRDKSEGRIKHFTVTQDFKDVTPEMLRWYMVNRDSESYRLWHPAHISFQWEKKMAGLGATWIGWERINGQLAAYRMRMDSVNLSPIPPKNIKNSTLAIVMDTEDADLFYILNEIKSVENGVHMTATFIFPEAVPDEYLEAHRRHYLEESSNMVYKAVPFLIQKTFGYIPDTEMLVKSGLVVPAED